MTAVPSLPACKQNNGVSQQSAASKLNSKKVKRESEDTFTVLRKYGRRSLDRSSIVPIRERTVMTQPLNCIPRSEIHYFVTILSLLSAVVVGSKVRRSRANLLTCASQHPLSLHKKK